MIWYLYSRQYVTYIEEITTTIYQQYQCHHHEHAFDHETWQYDSSNKFNPNWKENLDL